MIYDFGMLRGKMNADFGGSILWEVMAKKGMVGKIGSEDILSASITLLW